MRASTTRMNLESLYRRFMTTFKLKWKRYFGFCVLFFWLQQAFTISINLPTLQYFEQNATKANTSLWETLAPSVFQMGEDGFIMLPKHVRTVVIDVGARQSDYLRVLELSKDPSIALFLVDPLPDSIIPLSIRANSYMYNTSLDPQKLQVFTIKAALGLEEGIALFNVATGSACGSLLERNNQSAFWCTKVKQRIKVVVLTLHGLLRLIPPTVKSFHLKVDTEGADLMVLRGAKESIRLFQTVVIECGDDNNVHVRHHVNECQLSQARQYMENLGFSVEHQNQADLVNVFFLNKNITSPLTTFLAGPHSGNLYFGKWYRQKAKLLSENSA